MRCWVAASFPMRASYARLEDHGFYWSASESNPGSAWFYNFGKGGLSLNRQREGKKQMAVSVRRVKERLKVVAMVRAGKKDG